MEQTKSVLYETVQISALEHFRHDRERDTYPDSFKLTKYVCSQGTTFRTLTLLAIGSYAA